MHSPTTRAVVWTALCALASAACSDGFQPEVQPQLGKALGTENVTLCHNGQTVVVAAPSVAAHLAHGDLEGPCASDCVAPPEGLVGWWPFDETSGTVADNLLGTGDGFHWNDPLHVPGKVGYAIEHGLLPDRTVTTFPYTYFGAIPTLDFWVKTDWSNGHAIIDGGPTYYTWRIRIGSNGHVEYYHFRNGMGGYVGVTGTTDVSDRKWHHIATVADQESRRIDLYVDGQLEGTYTETNPRHTSWAGSATGEVKIGIANTRGWGPESFYGTIDELEVFDRPLTAGEIHSIWAAGADGKCKPEA